MFGTGVGFYEGMARARDRQHRGRMDLMRAFEDFKSNNPYATAADFQAFIDQAAGMDNYLRGGMPGKEVLSRLEQQNMERKRRDTIQANLSEMATRAQTMGQLEAIASQFIDNDDDLNAARQNFVQAMGGSDRLQGLQFDHLFTPQYRERRDAQRSVELLPVVSDLMEQTGGSASSAEIARKLGVTPRLAENLRQQAERRYQQQQNERLIKEHANFVDIIVTGARNGYDMTEIVSRLAQETGIDPARFQPIAEQARVQIERETRQRRGEQIALAEQRINDGARLRMVLQDPARGKELLRSHLEMYGDIDVDDDLVEKLWDRLAADHDAIRRTEWDQSRAALPERMEERLEERAETGVALVRNYTREDTPLQRVLLDLTLSHVVTNSETLMQLAQEYGGKNEDPIALRKQIIDSGIFPTREQARQSFMKSHEAANPKIQSYSQWDQDARQSIETGVSMSEARVEEFVQLAPELRADPVLLEELAGKIQRYYESVLRDLRAARQNAPSWMTSGEPFDDNRFNNLIRHVEAKRDRQLRRLQEVHQSALELVGQQQETAPPPSVQGGGTARPAPAQQSGTSIFNTPPPRFEWMEPGPSVTHGNTPAPPQRVQGAAPEEIPQYPQRDRFWLQ